ncbi:MAG: 3-isopropylmalate dehydratase small subunit, partial [Acetobacterium sp.]|nr:3-isopropylmalate dehydratase small subunit [Bacillota bacterium]MCG2731272.1 3-isopropylmalate dehydratase small subunit [Acetobacterium sp.]
VNGINVVIAESFARIFRQNMYNCGMFAIELAKETIDALFTDYAGKDVSMEIDVDGGQIIIDAEGKTETIDFKVGEFDKTLVKEGGWVGYADKNY